jgi:hypothetical protein
VSWWWRKYSALQVCAATIFKTRQFLTEDTDTCESKQISAALEDRARRWTVVVKRQPSTGTYCTCPHDLKILTRHKGPASQNKLRSLYGHSRFQYDLRAYPYTGAQADNLTVGYQAAEASGLPSTRPTHPHPHPQPCTTMRSQAHMTKRDPRIARLQDQETQR